MWGGQSYVACVGGRGAGVRVGQCPLCTRKGVVPLFVPEALVDRHDVALGGEDVLVVGLVQRVVLIKQLQWGKKQEIKQTLHQETLFITSTLTKLHPKSPPKNNIFTVICVNNVLG